MWEVQPSGELGIQEERQLSSTQILTPNFGSHGLSNGVVQLKKPDKMVGVEKLKSSFILETQKDRHKSSILSCG
jgi:hypothetical protein